jgi:DNA repair exonuclease SbcCD ATPase subunit
LRLHRLRVADFAGIREADIEFGPGLNVLYGPNDLGKSTLAEAIRLALLLPHTSTHIEDYVPWTGGRDPVIEMTFETEPQRIWRVRKEFRRSGAALLQESKDGVDFEDVERARKVDGKLRDLLRWGIPEPGGAGGSKGLPTSFLATVLLSTQSDVSSVLSESLQGDATGTGRDRIAAALQAVAQDPLFVALLRATQARRDEAYTDRGAKKTAKGSVFKAAADRLNWARDEKEELQKIVDDSEGVEKQLRDLTAKRGQLDESVATATDRLTALERLATEAAKLAEATEQLRLAREEVLRIQKIGSEVDAAERNLKDLSRKVEEAQRALKVAQGQDTEAVTALKVAEEAVRAAGSDRAMTDIVARQRLELRKAEADQASKKAQQQIDGAIGAQKLVDDVATAEREHQAHQAEADGARARFSNATVKQGVIADQLRRVDVIGCALDARTADDQAAVAQADVDKESTLQARLKSETGEREVLVGRRATITVPGSAALVAMRRLDTDLAAARGALSVGLVVTVTPRALLEVRVQKDRTTANSVSTVEPMEIEANTEIDIDIVDVAAVRVRGGRPEAQKRTETLEERWSREVAPHVAAANVSDLDSLATRIDEAQDLDLAIKAKNAELESLRNQIASLADSPRVLREASNRAKVCRAALGGLTLDTFAAELAALGTDPTGALRQRRQQLTNDLEMARATENEARTTHTLAEERVRNSKSRLDAAVVARDAALTVIQEGIVTTLSVAQAALAAASAEQQKIAAELASLETTVAAQNARIEAALSGARATSEQARVRVETAQSEQTKAIAEHASQAGRLDALQKQRDAEEIAIAENRLREATERLATVLVPDRIVTEGEVTNARSVVAQARLDLEGTEREIQRTHGALEQVGGAVARERLRDAIEAFDLAERQEREIEVDYEAWSLLLEQMKQADAAQASNLGQTLAPAIAGRFEALTQRRYENVRLTAQLGTEGVVATGTVRPTNRVSVGTREQLSTLYRLSMAEYLRTTLVLDDQLVQSDDMRMDWFRALLVEKAHSFQIVVFTCRPGDYLAAGATVPEGNAIHRDTDGGFVRAVDLARALQQK